MSNQSKKQNKMGITIIIISIVFMVFSLPTASIQGELLSYLLSFDLGLLIITICNSLSFTYQASNFFLLLLTNQAFKREFNILFGWRSAAKKTFVHTNGGSTQF